MRTQFISVCKVRQGTFFTGSLSQQKIHILCMCSYTVYNIRFFADILFADFWALIICFISINTWMSRIKLFVFSFVT